MIRWLVKKVVKYAVEELRESGELDRIVSRLDGSGKSVFSAAKTAVESEISSREALADLAVSHRSDVKVSDVGSTKKVEGDRERNMSVMNQLKNLGD